MAVTSSGWIDIQSMAELRLLGLSELLRIYRHEDVCFTSEKFAVALNGLDFVKIMRIHLIRP